MPTNLYQATPEKPSHLSVGAILIDEDQKIICHYWPKLRDMEDIYFLMKETVEEGEYLVDTLKRGLAQEFGAIGEVITFVGSRVSEDEWFGEIGKPTKVEKTTLFFLVKLLSFDESSREKGKDTSESQIVHLDIDDLIEKCKIQAQKYNWKELAEYEILEKVKTLAFSKLI